MPTLANHLHDLRIEGKICGERQDGSRPLVYRALRDGETPEPRFAGGASGGEWAGQRRCPARAVEARNPWPRH
ncbi:MAG: hypothetical protein ACREV3_06560 [Gammaproteobacteria bacterium]